MIARHRSPRKSTASRSWVTSRSPTARGVVDDTHAQLGGLERVANIVGLATFVEDVFAIDTDTWGDLRINLVHHLDVSRAAARPDRRRHRRRVRTGRVGQRHLQRGFERRMQAGEAGVMSLARAMASRWGPHGIRVNCTCADVILTPRLVESSQMPPGGPPVGEEIVLGRWGQPEDMPRPLVFLLSRLSSFMTGRTLVVDGGSMIHFPHELAARRRSP